MNERQPWVRTQFGRALALVTLLGTLLPWPSTAGPPNPAADAKPAMAPDDKTNAQVANAYGQLPLYFIQNNGQVDKRVKFYEKGNGHATYFTKDGVYVSLVGASRQTSTPESTLVKLVPLGANKNPKMVAEGVQEGKVNYFVGNNPKKWRPNVPTYQAVAYKELYPGIDMKFYGNNRQLEYDVIVKPGADPSKVRFAYEGIESLRITEEGELEIGLKDGTMRQRKPVLYQEIGGARVPVEGAFTLVSPNARRGMARSGRDAVYGFDVASYDTDYPLVIDPVLVYATYLGGSVQESAQGIAVDGVGNAYVTGNTNSTNFPMANPLQATLDVDYDAFVTKLNASGTALVYSTYLGGNTSEMGGSSAEQGIRIAVDGVGNAYVTGYTNSTNFPTANAVQPAPGGGTDAFVTKLNASGTALIYSTYLGGSSPEIGHGIVVDGAGNAYVAGVTMSTNFPTANPLQAALDGTHDAFVTKLNASGTALIYSTYLGGSLTETPFGGIAVDGAGNVYVTGNTNSTNFPMANPLQAALDGTHDAFVTKLNASGTALVYSTYLGGSGDEIANDIAVDAAGRAHVTGYTASTNFPTANPVQAALGGTQDAFVTKLNASGTALIYSTYLGGSEQESAQGIAVDGAGDAYVTGSTRSTNFPTADALQPVLDVAPDAFVTKLNAVGSALAYSTYLGGSGVGGDVGRDISVDSAGNAYVAGQTGATNFPTANAVQPASGGGGQDAFVAKIGPPSLVSITVTPGTPTLLVGQTQAMAATGTFSDGSTRILIAGEGTWVPKPSMPTARRELAAGVVNGILYALGGTSGTSSSGDLLGTVEAYDPMTNTWAQAFPMPTARKRLAVGVVNGILYAIGGIGVSGTQVLSTVEAYDPMTNTWTTKAPMPTGLYDHAIGVVDGVLYVMGGSDSSSGNSSTTVLAYDPTANTWATKASMPTSRTGHSVGVVSGMLYAVGGLMGGNGLTPTVLATVEAYDPTTNTWATKAPMPTARYLHSVGVVNGMLYALGGSPGGGTSTFPTVEAYDPATNTWATTASMSMSRAYLAVGVVSGVLYAVGGVTNLSYGSLTTVEVYISPEVTWSNNNGSVATIDINGLATALSPGTTTITAVSAGIIGNTTLTVTDTGTPLEADLVITKSHTPDPVVIGLPVTYIITVTNLGPSPATGVAVTDTLPTGVIFNSVIPTQGSCTAPMGGVVTCTVGTLPNGASATISLIVTVTTAGVIGNTASVSGNESDPSLANNTAVDIFSIPGGRLANISTRAFVGTGADVAVGGFIISGSGTKQVLLRGFGPTLTDFGVTGVLANPTLALEWDDDNNPNTPAIPVLTNNDWGTPVASCNVPVVACGSPQDILNSGMSADSYAPTNPNRGLDAALLLTLPPGTYTARMSGVSNGTGVGLIGVDDVDTNQTATLINISTRAFVGTGSNVAVGGFIITGMSNKQVLLRGFGPTLADFGVTGALANPTLDLEWDDDNNPNTPAIPVLTNDDWGTAAGSCPAPVVACGTPQEILNTGMSPNSYAPTNPNRHLDSALLVTLPPGTYTARLSGVSNGTGVGLIGVDQVGP